MAAGCCGDGLRLRAPGVVEDDGEGAGLARKHDGATGHGVERHVVTPVGKRDRVEQFPGFGHDARPVAAAVADEGGGEDGVGVERRGPGGRRHGGGEAGAGRAQEVTAVDQWGGHGTILLL